MATISSAQAATVTIPGHDRIALAYRDLDRICHLLVLDLSQFEPVQPLPDFLRKYRRNLFAARWVGMNEVRRHQPGLVVVPVRHGALTAHGIECVKEPAACLLGHTLL